MRRHEACCGKAIVLGLLLAPVQALASAWTAVPATSTLSADVGGRDEGHAYIDDTVSWTPRVARFMRQIRFLR